MYHLKSYRPGLGKWLSYMVKLCKMAGWSYWCASQVVICLDVSSIGACVWAEQLCSQFMFHRSPLLNDALFHQGEKGPWQHWPLATEIWGPTRCLNVNFTMANTWGMSWVEGREIRPRVGKSSLCASRKWQWGFCSNLTGCPVVRFPKRRS